MALGFGSYEIARSGLFVSERGLYVTGHNISNVNTPGYVRQQAMVSDSGYQTGYTRNGLLQVGLGADIQQIRQIRHMFLDGIYRQENTTLGYWESRAKALQDIEAILGEPFGTGLQDMMNKFYDAWHELSKEPDSLTIRALVRQRGEALVNHVNHIGKQLDRLQNDLNSELKVRIDEVNGITAQIAKLNAQIMKIEATGDTANDYRDQRNVLIDRLSKLADVQTMEMQDGQISITLGGYTLVNKDVHKKLVASESRPGEIFYVPKLEGTDIVVPIKNGIIKGLMESRGEVSGASGSIQNGTPNTKADIIFAIDVSDTSSAYLDNIKANISGYLSGLKNAGLDYNLRLITYDGSVVSNSGFGTDDEAFEAAIAALVPSAGTENNFGNDGDDTITSLIEGLESITDFMPDANKFAFVFTGESLNGDGGIPVTDADASDYADRLNALGINMSVVTDSAYFTLGDSAAEAGWNKITEATGGKLYDINVPAGDFGGMMISMANDTNSAVNENISNIEQSNNIISDVRQRLNALINIMFREVNSLHRSGKTLGDPPSDGEDFFTVINAHLPLEMGNIKLNDNFSDLNKIVASESGKNSDNIIALKIANLRHKPLITDATGILTLDEYYQSIVQQIGHSGSNAISISGNQQKLVEQADASRQSISAVSMDEEMTNMMKFKYAYNASSRAINIIDAMIETIITKMGLVGR
jgi:flagellar hook-associated protein 1 FlgK